MCSSDLLQPWSYHVFNLAIHLSAGLVLFGLLRRVLGTSVASYLTALLWLVHPLQTESVMYVTQRTELMAGLFLMLTLYCFVRSVGSPVVRRWELAAVSACVLGVGCKEVVAVAPVLVLVYDRLFIARSHREAWRQQIGRAHV